MSVTSIAIAVVEHDDRYVVGRRAAHLPLGGLWEFPGGKIESHESPRAAAARECLEETGLRVTVSHCLLVHLQQYAHGEVKLLFFACQPVDPEVPLAEPFQWVDRWQLKQMQFPAGNRPLLERLLAGI